MITAASVAKHTSLQHCNMQVYGKPNNESELKNLDFYYNNYFFVLLTAAAKLCAAAAIVF